MLKFTYRTVPLLLILLLGMLFGSVGHASAQSLDAFFGVGTATDSSNGQSYAFFSGNICPGSSDCLTAPKMTGALGSFGVDFMLNKHLGFGGEYAFRFSQEPYAGLAVRPTFYDFNVIYHPTDKWSRVVPVLEGGIGGATVHIYYNQANCTIICQNQSTLIQNSSHFQLHGAAGLKLYVKPHVFIRPQIDLHYVTRFPEFGSHFVPQYTLAIGYTFGGS